jgi:hypothetical protein
VASDNLRTIIGSDAGVWILAFGVILICGVSVAQTSAPMPSMWMDPNNLERPHTKPFQAPLTLINTAEVKRERTLEQLDVITPLAPFAQQQGRITVMVETGIYSAISSSLATYTDDLANMGFSSIVVQFSGDAEYLRDTLITLYNEAESLVGAVLIGDLPYVIYEMNQDWGWGWEYEDFICDFYFMDMDGEWLDQLDDGQVQPNNGKLDTWIDNNGLEIWVSRMKTGNLPSLGSETDILNNYFARNHTLRWDLLNSSLMGLVYNDDSWEDMAADDADSLESVFGSGNVITVSHPEDTTALDYITNRLTANYHLDFVRSHGSPAGHGFYRSDGAIFEWVIINDYIASDPEAVFFSLFVCSGCDYATSNYLGGIVAFNPEADGLLSWGSTKTGGMFDDHHMYNRIAAGDCMGEAFRDWFNQVKDDWPSWAPQYWYGMVLLGDASLASGSPILGDFEPDGDVDFNDLTILVNQWLQIPGSPSADIAPQPGGDNFVDFRDFALFAESWLEGTRK